MDHGAKIPRDAREEQAERLAMKSSAFGGSSYKGLYELNPLFRVDLARTESALGTRLAPRFLSVHAHQHLLIKRGESC
jgi:hypothetical protein